MLTVRAGLSFLRLISPFVRSRAASLAGAAALLVAYSAAAVSPALITQQLVDRGLATGDVPLVAALALALVAAAATQSVLSVLAARVLSEAGEGVAADLRAELVRRALDAPAGWMAGRDDGYVAARVTEASGVSALFSKTSFTFASSVLQAAGSAVAVAAMSPSVLAFAIAPIPAYVWCAGRSLKAYRASVAAAAEAAAGLTGRVAEAVSGREEAAASGGSRLVAGRVGGASERVRSASVRQSVLAALTGEGMSLLSTASASLVFVACAALAGSLSVGRVLAAVRLAARVYSPFLVAVSAAITVQPALAALQRAAEAFPEPLHGGGIELVSPVRSIEVRNLSFRYGEGARPLLGGLTATFQCPSLVVVGGANGSGKSTLLRVLLGLVDGWEGEVFVDGVSLGDVSPGSWRARCAAVRQRPFLLNASLRENVMFGAGGADDAAYRAVLAASGLDEVAKRLPEGDASPVGPAGSLLSGGERQRVAIARALLRGADVLLLDEPATGLDPAAKASLRDLLARLAREHLVVAVDHEGLFDDVADQVIVLEAKQDDCEGLQ